MEWLSDLLDRFVLDASDLSTGRSRIAGIAVGGQAGATSYLEACRLLGEAATDGADLIEALDQTEDPSLIDRVGFLVIACFASLRASYPARPDAVTARTKIVTRANGVVDEAGTIYGHVLHGWLSTLVGTTTEQLTQIAATRAPLVRVETDISLPASLLAWDLYGDPIRDSELVDRNQTGTAFVMPIVLEALAP